MHRADRRSLKRLILILAIPACALGFSAAILTTPSPPWMADPAAPTPPTVVQAPPGPAIMPQTTVTEVAPVPPPQIVVEQAPPVTVTMPPLAPRPTPIPPTVLAPDPVRAQLLKLFPDPPPTTAPAPPVRVTPPPTSQMPVPMLAP